MVRKTSRRDDAPASRPLRLSRKVDLISRFENALAAGDGVDGAHCIHELWMRGEMGVHIQRSLDRLWQSAAASIPRHLEHWPPDPMGPR